MGNQNSKAKKINRLIDGKLKKHKKEVSILLLGAGESGKSTIFKQLKIIFKNGYSKNEERIIFKDIIYRNIVKAMKALVDASLVLNIPIQNTENRERASKLKSIKYEDLRKIENIWTPELSREIALLWEDSGIQKTYSDRAKFQLDDSSKYYFDEIDRVTDENYIPTLKDILLSRVRTGGYVTELQFKLHNLNLKMVDVGGQRCERKKWIHCFEGCTAIIFVTSLSEYNQKCYEDEDTNRMKESLLIFDEICNSRWFLKTPIILFLNKEDIFNEKIKKSDLKICFPNYKGGCNAQNALNYIAKRFTGLNKYPDLKKIYTHVTNATDTKQLKSLFVSDEIKKILLSKEMLV